MVANRSNKVMTSFHEIGNNYLKTVLSLFQQVPGCQYEPRGLFWLPYYRWLLVELILVACVWLKG